MNAVVLVGGVGTRLRPLTLALPKPLVPVLNRPMLEYLLVGLQRHGVTNVVLATAAGESRLETALGDGSRLGLRITYSYESQPLGSGLAVKKAAQNFQGRFFVCNGDVVADFNLGSMLEHHVEKDAAMSVCLTRVGDPSAFGIAEVEPDGRISRFLEKPGPGQTRSHAANAGTWIFEPEVVDLIPDERMDGSIERLVMPLLIGQRRLVLGYSSDAYWMDAGTPERYLQLHHDLLSGAIPSWLPNGVRASPGPAESAASGSKRPSADQTMIGDNCQVAPDARINGPSVLGNNCSLAPASLVEASVLWQRVQVGAEAQIRDSIIGEGCWIGPGSNVSGAVIANGARVEAGVELTPGTRLDPGEVAR